jgi:glutamate formiminotransferase
LGAVDVLPFVPIRDVTTEECVQLAREVAVELAALHDLPVFLYAHASPEGHSLPLIRREAFNSISPDHGPAAPHPTAGAAVVGAREPLIAYNVNLATADVRIAQSIAREIRALSAADDPVFRGVRALGLYLASRSIAQVSMNVTRPAETPLLPIFRFIENRALELGTSVLESEVIGALPGYAAFQLAADAIKARGLTPGQVLLENWLA